MTWSVYSPNLTSLVGGSRQVLFDGEGSYLIVGVDGVQVAPLDVDQFLELYDLDAATAPSRIADLYVGIASDLGATAEAWAVLSSLTTRRSLSMTATSKTPKAAPGPKAPKAAPEPKAPKAAKIASEQKVPKTTPGPKVEKAPRTGSVSGRICELLLENKWDDDEIFAKVQQELGLADDKRSYIAWNRANLRKQGKLPPK